MTPIKTVRRISRKCICVVALLGAWFTAVGHAHEIRPAVVTLIITADARYQAELSINLEAMLAGVSPEHRDTNESPNARQYDTLRALSPDALRARVESFLPGFLDELRIEFDGEVVRPAADFIEIPPSGDLVISRVSRIRLSGTVPQGAKTLRWQYPERFGASVLRLQRPQDQEAYAVWLKTGEVGTFALHGDIAAKSRARLAADYVVLGFTHILPKGLDHILFVLGLFLLSARLKPLLVQVTAFTIAHSITLALAIYGIFSLPSEVVEPLIAVSIVYVAVENVFTSRLHGWRTVVVFAFGLLHGMGFAGVLQEVGLPRAEFWTGLVAFNIGVELGQLAVIALAFGLVGAWGRTKSWYRPRVVIPVSLAIAAIGLYWTAERAIG